MKRKFLAPLLILVLAACTAHQAYVAVGATVQLVDTGMSIWADYVVAQAKAQGVSPAAWNPSQQATIKKAFDGYQAAITVARTAMHLTNSSPSPEELSKAAATVISYIEQFTGKKVAP